MIPCFNDSSLNVEYAQCILWLKDNQSKRGTSEFIEKHSRAREIREYADKNYVEVVCWSKFKTDLEWRQFLDNNIEELELRNLEKDLDFFDENFIIEDIENLLEDI